VKAKKLPFVLSAMALVALVGCSPSPTATVESYGEAQPLVKSAKADLAERLGISSNDIEVESVEETQFRDASLGVPEPGKVYAQVITPGYIIRLAAEDAVYEYHASDKRVVLLPTGTESAEGSITIQSVHAERGEITFSGQSTLSQGTCLRTQLFADGTQVAWWPADACANVQDGAWEIAVPLPEEGLDPSVQYVLHVRQQGAPSVEAKFPFDSTGPPTPES
jgi:hypothetical protein